MFAAGPPRAKSPVPSADVSLRSPCPMTVNAQRSHVARRRKGGLKGNGLRAAALMDSPVGQLSYERAARRWPDPIVRSHFPPGTDTRRLGLPPSAVRARTRCDPADRRAK